MQHFVLNELSPDAGLVPFIPSFDAYNQLLLGKSAPTFVNAAERRVRWAPSKYSNIVYFSEGF
jgi:hypothetical protein